VLDTPIAPVGRTAPAIPSTREPVWWADVRNTGPGGPRPPT